MNKTFRHIASAFAVIVFLVLAFGSENEEAIEKEVNSKNIVMDISAKQLYADYEANGIAADKKYKDNVIRITGIVSEIDSDIFDAKYVSIEGDGYFGVVQCYLGDSYASVASHLAKGQTITVRGTCNGKTLVNIILKGCVVEDMKP